MAAAAATVDEVINTALPSVEVVKITIAADGDWYDSKKFRKVLAAHVTMLGAIAATDAYSIASLGTTLDNRVTIKAVGTTSATLLLTVYGTH